MYLTEQLEQEYIAKLCNMLWILWKARNKEIFQSSKQEPRGILAQARLLQFQPQETNHAQNSTNQNPIQITVQGMAVLIDASWEV